MPPSRARLIGVVAGQLIHQPSQAPTLQPQSTATIEPLIAALRAAGVTVTQGQPRGQARHAQGPGNPLRRLQVDRLTAALVEGLPPPAADREGRILHRLQQDAIHAIVVRYVNALLRRRAGRPAPTAPSLTSILTPRVAALLADLARALAAAAPPPAGPHPGDHQQLEHGLRTLFGDTGITRIALRLGYDHVPQLVQHILG